MKTPRFAFFFYFLCFFLTPGINAQWVYLGSPQTGYPLDFDQDGDRIYMCASAGIFYTDNNGELWVPVVNTRPFTHPKQVWAEEGHLFVSNSAHSYEYGRATDIWRSDDNGVSWEKIWGGELKSAAITGDTVAVLANDSIAISLDGGQTYSFRYPAPFPYYAYNIFWFLGRLYQSGEDELSQTTDWGATWQTVYANYDAYTVRFTTFANRLWRAEIWQNGGFMTFDWSDDNGQSWHFFSNGGDPSIYSYIFGNEEYAFIYYNTDADLWRHTIDAVSLGIYNIQDAPWTAMEMFNGVIYSGKRDKGVLVSKDFGASFQFANNGFRGFESLRLAASSPDTLWLMDSDDPNGLVPHGGNIYQTLNGGYDWNKHLVQGGGLVKIAASPDGWLVGFTAGYSFRSADNGQSWEYINNTAFNSGTTVSFWDVRYTGGRFFLTTTSHGNWYSEDNGASWQPLAPFGQGIYVYGISHNQGKYTLVTSTPNGWRPRISDDGVVWSDITYNLGLANCYNEGISWTYHHGNRVFAYACDRLQMLDLQGTTWQTRWIVAPNYSYNYPAGWPDEHPRVEQMYAVGNRLFACVRGHGVFVSEDNGDTWATFNDGLTNFEVTSVSPVGDFLYLSTGGGLWRRSLADLGLQQKTGLVFLDDNGNSQLDTLETGFPNIVVKSTDGLSCGVSQADGALLIYASGAVSGFYAPVLPKWTELTTPALPVQTPDSALRFGLRYLPDIYDGSVDLTNITLPRPGFDFDLMLTYANSGTSTSDFLLKLTLSDEATFESASPSPDAIVGDTLFWNIPNLSPGTAGYIHIRQKISNLTDIGTPVIQTAVIHPVQFADADTSDNIAQFSLLTVGSYDPNDKAVQPEGALSLAMVADSQRLVYTIRFQNTGNYPASFVRIRDTLSTNLNLGSIRTLTASHPFTWRLLPGRVVEFEFLNINLPDSTTNEAASHGFVKFSIEVLPDLMLTDHIRNNADIYFDFNAPVRTNTVENVVSNLIASFEPVTGNFTVYPVPATDHLIIAAKNGVFGSESVSITDIYGRTVAEYRISSHTNEFRLEIQHLPPGAYGLVFQTGSGKEVLKFIKI